MEAVMTGVSDLLDAVVRTFREPADAPSGPYVWEHLRTGAGPDRPLRGIVEAARQSDTVHWPDAPALPVEWTVLPPVNGGPARLLLLGDPQAAVERLGGHGYRLLLVRAGALLEGARLAASAAGFSAMVRATPSDVREALGCDGTSRQVLGGIDLTPAGPAAGGL
jgi:hypothetical protein